MIIAAEGAKMARESQSATDVKGARLARSSISHTNHTLPRLGRVRQNSLDFQ
jgi:hypothetical protein